MYRITTISAIDGKPTTRARASADAADKAWQVVMANRHFYSVAIAYDGARIVKSYVSQSVLLQRTP